MSTLSPNHSPDLNSSMESKLIVRQPQKLQELGNLLLTIENLSARVSEGASEDRSGDRGGGPAGTGGGAIQGAGQRQTSPRDIAIANIPVSAIIQRDMEAFIKKEIKKLNRQAKSVSHLSRPGTAFALNELYAKIRRLNALLAEILEAGVEVLRRLFIRVFIDRQPIL